MMAETHNAELGLALWGFAEWAAPNIGTMSSTLDLAVITYDFSGGMRPEMNGGMNG